MIPVIASTHLPAMTGEAIQKARELESILRDVPQIPVRTHHVIHGGMYARTIRIPAGAVLTGALIKIPTMLIISGHATAYIGGETIELCGYQAIPGSAGRKQVFVAHADTDMTMLFPTSAMSVEQAESEFTDETHLLFSRHSENDTITITGE